MSNVDNFFKRHDGFSRDVDGYPREQPFQCVDVFHLFNSEILGLGYVSAQPTGGARDYYENFDGLGLGSHYVRIKNDPNDPNQLPQKGDVIIWGSTVGEYGHIAIFSHVSSGQRFVSFDQNWGGRVCHYQEHTWAGVLGWLRPHIFVTKPASSATGGNELMTPQFIKETYFAAVGRYPEQADIDFHMAKSNPESFINGFSGEYLWKHLKAQVDTLVSQLKNITAERDSLMQNVNANAAKIAELNQEIISLNLQINALKSVTPEAGQDAPPATSQPVPDPVTEPAPASPATPPVSDGEAVPVIVRPSDWRDTYTPEVATWQSIEAVKVIDFDNKQPTLDLPVGQLVEGAGSFRFHNKTYIRSAKSLLNGYWYGVPVESLKLVIPKIETDTDIDDLLNDPNWLDDMKDEAQVHLPESSFRTKLVTAFARLQGYLIKLASFLQFWKKKQTVK
jgi:hypothetical protein